MGGAGGSCYTDLRLHDMEPGLADNMGEGNATGSEWRTPPLWSIGLTAGVSGGVQGDLPQHVRIKSGSPHRFLGIIVSIKAAKLYDIQRRRFDP